jgi:hypothetical protein
MNFHHTKRNGWRVLLQLIQRIFLRGKNGSKVTILRDSSPWLSSFCSVAALLTAIVAFGSPEPRQKRVLAFGSVSWLLQLCHQLLTVIAA